MMKVQSQLCRLTCACISISQEYAKYLWVDEQFGALINYLEEKGIYDETLVILQADHGVEAKGTQ